MLASYEDDEVREKSSKDFCLGHSIRYLFKARKWAAVQTKFHRLYQQGPPLNLKK